jgi:hypothetical protein
MVNFTYTPSQYYSRTPQVNQTGFNTAGISASQPYYTNYNLATYNGYNPANPLPGTIGYNLPAQNYYNYGINNLAYYGTQTLKTAVVSTAINAGVNIVNNVLNNTLSPAVNRLSGSGYPPGASNGSMLRPASGNSSTAFADDTEDRVIIYDQSGKFIGQSSILAPLNQIGGVLFPITPTITVSHTASYEMQNLVHTNYSTPLYQHSSVNSIGINGQFSANYPAEAEYIVAVIHFFRSVTKMFYGQDSLAGTPPPVLFLDAYGPYTFDHIPVVVGSFDYSFPADVDYISCEVGGYKQKVPTLANCNMNLIPLWSRNKISNEFGVDNFVNGSLIQGSPGGSGGWL